MIHWSTVFQQMLSPIATDHVLENREKMCKHLEGSLAPLLSGKKNPTDSDKPGIHPQSLEDFYRSTITCRVNPIIKAFPIDFIYFYIVYDMKIELFKFLCLSRAPWKDYFICFY